MKALIISPGQVGPTIFDKKQGLKANRVLRQAAPAGPRAEPVLRAADGLVDLSRMLPSYDSQGTAGYSTAWQPRQERELRGGGRRGWLSSPKDRRP